MFSGHTCTHTHELGCSPGLWLHQQDKEQFLLQNVISCLLDGFQYSVITFFFHQTVLTQVQTLPTHGLEEERAPSGTISCPFPPAPASCSRCLWAAPGALLQAQSPRLSLEGLCHTLGAELGEAPQQTGVFLFKSHSLHPFSAQCRALQALK